VLGFVDAAVNRLLDVDGEHEAAIALIALGRTVHRVPDAPAVMPLGLPTVRLSPSHIDYPAIGAMHEASSLVDGREVAAWRQPYPPPSSTPGRSALGQVIPGPRVEPPWLPADPVETVIHRRGSSRRFAQEPIGVAQLATLLDRGTGNVPLECLSAGSAPLAEAYLIVNAVDGLRPGAYHLRPSSWELELLRDGEQRRRAGALALGQSLAAAAAVNLYYLADLGAVLAHFGNRGYRAAQLSAAIQAGRVYLAAYALGLGATGLTFFDDDVTAFFSPHAAGRSVMFLMAVGRPWRSGDRAGPGANPSS
jgi:SagB-type dehydrogenase family enzyme